MITFMKNDAEIVKAVQRSQDALDENCVVLEELLKKVYGVSELAKDRIAKLLDRGDDGQNNSSGV